jgi:phosphodiesterase/alkaline phosphatase D-like protein
MRSRVPRLLGLSVAVGAVTAGVAGAAASPTVTTGPATKVATASAVLTGHVSPNGSATAYVFSYGPTPAYGAATAARSVGSGAKSIAVTRRITGLTPGTIYHYRITATNRSGTATGADRTFTTAGHPPAGVVTGPPASVGKTVATPTGTVDPEGAVTNWVIQYGITGAYGFETFAQSLGPVATPVPVSAQLTGLAPGTLFHYRVVAYHGAAVVSAGADATFFTEPSRRPRPRMTAHTRPGTDRRSPYVFTTSGVLGGAGWIPPAQRCAGNVGVRFYNRRRQVAFVVAPVAANCRFAVRASFRRLRGPRPAALRITVDYRGTGYLAPINRVDHVTAG